MKKDLVWNSAELVSRCDYLMKTQTGVDLKEKPYILSQRAVCPQIKSVVLK